eukprot:1322676-Pyramimonas_sp.AAC.1
MALCWDACPSISSGLAGRKPALDVADQPRRDASPEQDWGAQPARGNVLEVARAAQPAAGAAATMATGVERMGLQLQPVRDDVPRGRDGPRPEGAGA